MCLVLGVAALAGVGSLASAINAGLAERGQLLLGGDLAARFTGREPLEAERAAAARLGQTGEVIKLRGMVARADGGDAVLAEVKAVDAAWPLYGAAVMDGGKAYVPAPGTAAGQPALADRLRLKPGDMITLGQARLR